MGVEVNTLNLTIPKDFAWVLAGLVTLSAQLFIVNLVFVGRVRKRVFKKTDLQKVFGDDHKKHTNATINPLGYPDFGQGRYSDQLSYGDWYDFNIAQRIHYTFIEFFIPFIVISLVAGLYKPCYTAFFVFGAVFSRICFHIGYASGNAQHPIRVLGAGLQDFCFLANLILSVMGVLSWLGYI